METNISIKLNRNGFSVVSTPLRFKCNYNLHNLYNYKLDNSISRAKNIVYDLVLNNDFKYFVTITLNGIHNDLDLSTFRKNFNSRLKYMRKKRFL